MYQMKNINQLCDNFKDNKIAYIRHPGGSGSHLYLASLDYLDEFIAVGEVSIPRKLCLEIKDDPYIYKFMMYFINMVHCDKPLNISDNKNSIIVTSGKSHKNSLYAKESGINVEYILLKRSIEKTAISRTFKKDFWRNYSGFSNLKDLEYLKSQHKLIVNFYSLLLNLG